MGSYEYVKQNAALLTCFCKEYLNFFNWDQVQVESKKMEFRRFEYRPVQAGCIRIFWMASNDVNVNVINVNWVLANLRSATEVKEIILKYASRLCGSFLPFVEMMQ